VLFIYIQIIDRCCKACQDGNDKNYGEKITGTVKEKTNYQSQQGNERNSPVSLKQWLFIQLLQTVSMYGSTY
jgi:hypothetical protein